ncbi:hypothetical protein C2845_PM01G47600 [Panicum miliaceum]|uniref:Uncharacterized protein n=1 Tax=Panicum miliaceum TaxID=4540 RepID=A0A3L6TPI3_PANMI|nr:hypothetical protein C2845_PM01G47600 [Panicum miliaceum]
MPPRRRARLSSRPYSSVAAAEQCPRGWLAARRNRPSKRARRLATATAQGGKDDGTPLTDEILVGIFAGLPGFSDLVRCAATCRQWCRLVSGEAAFICRAARCRPPPLRSLALGFFYSHRDGAVPRFAATASASRRLGLRRPSLNALVEGLDDGLFDASRVVASRNGLLLVELQRRKRERALKLCVCNPMTGEVTVLPPLGGKEISRPFACAIFTAEDDDESHLSDPPSAPSSYRLLLVYGRRGFTACRTYSSDGGRWGPQAKAITAVRLGKKTMASMTGTGAVVVRNVAYWRAMGIVLGVRLHTLQAEHVDIPLTGHDPAGNTLLGVSPNGRLRVVQVVEQMMCRATGKVSIAIGVSTRSTAGDKWDPLLVIEVVGRFLPAETTWMRLRWLCEKSGVVFLTAGCAGDQTSDVYALSLDRQEAERVASHHGGDGDLHGYEMDRTSYLRSLAMDEDDDDP